VTIKVKKLKLTEGHSMTAAGYRIEKKLEERRSIPISMFDMKNIRNLMKPTWKRIWLRVKTLVLGGNKHMQSGASLLLSARRTKIFAFLVREPKN